MISFDWDGTLALPKIKEIFYSLKDTADVCIITSRHENIPVSYRYNNYELLEFAKENSIKVYFTNGEDKWKIIKELNILTHYDDDDIEIELIHENTKCKCLYVPMI